MITFAKGITNGAVPMGGVLGEDRHLRRLHGRGTDWAIELFHGYTYSGHPLAAAAGLATLDIYRDEGLFDARQSARAAVRRDAVHALKGAPHVDRHPQCRPAAAIELEPHTDGAGQARLRGADRAFEDEALVIRASGDTLCLAPALIARSRDRRMVDGVRRVLDRLD